MFLILNQQIYFLKVSLNFYQNTVQICKYPKKLKGLYTRNPSSPFFALCLTWSLLSEATCSFSW